MTLFKLVIFDLDGVLIDSRGNMEHAWAAVQKEHGISVPFESYFSLIGRPFKNIMEVLGLGAGAAEYAGTYRAASMRRVELVKPFAGVPEALRLLSAGQRKLAVVTSKERIRTDAMLKDLPVKFHSVQCPSEAYRGKPAPDYLLLAMAQCGVDPAHSVFVGDMPSDHEAARRAGIRFLHVEWGYGDCPDPRVPRMKNCESLTRYILGESNEDRGDYTVQIPIEPVPWKAAG